MKDSMKKEQYQEKSFYNETIVKPQMRDYETQYPFSRGDTKVPSDMHGEKVNRQEGP